MENKDKMVELALGYLKRGWSVLPCGKDKVPLIPWKKFQEEYASESTVRSWFDNFPEAQVGVITGKISNLTVIDFEKGADPSIVPQDTFIVQTGGMGFHFYYLYEEGVRNKTRVLPLVDFRSEAGFVVAGGSYSEKGPYTILQDVPLIPFPKELFPTRIEKIDIFQTPDASTPQLFEKKPLNEYPGYSTGQRNDGMTRYIGYVLTQIHPADWVIEGWNVVQQANTRNTPPLGLLELRTIFESVVRLERRNNPQGRVSGAHRAFGGVSSARTEPIILSDGSDEIKHLATVAEEQKIDQTDIYPLQMPCFDNVILGGVAPGDLVVVAGKTGEGKTSLCQDWTLSLIRGEKHPKSLWFSYEVLPTHLWNKFQEMGMSQEDCVFIPAKHSSGNVTWVEQKIKEGKEKFGIKIVMIDHLGFLLPKTDGTLGVKNLSSNYSTFLTQVVRDLKTIALKEEVIIFLPVHMRKTEKGNRRSDVEDIKDSSGVAQESDLVFLIEREKNKDQDAKSYFTDTTKITLAKNRKTGQTVIGNFTMVNGRFAYDDSKEKVNEVFESFGKPKVDVPKITITEEIIIEEEGIPDDIWNAPV